MFGHEGQPEKSPVDNVTSPPRPVTDFAKPYELSGGGKQAGIYDLTDDVTGPGGAGYRCGDPEQP